MKKLYKKPEPGDKVEVVVNREKQKGTYLESHDKGVLLLKLDSGYNIGLKKEDISEVKVLERKEKEKEKSKKPKREE